MDEINTRCARASAAAVLKFSPSPSSLFLIAPVQNQLREFWESQPGLNLLGSNVRARNAVLYTKCFMDGTGKDEEKPIRKPPPLLANVV